MSVRLVLQNNLIYEKDLEQIKEACLEAGAKVQEVKVIPFTKKLPEFTYGKKNVYYGSTTLMYNIYKKLSAPLGLFYNPKTFLMEQYQYEWGKHMLNSDGLFMKVSAFINSHHNFNIVWGESDEKIFIRPNGDGKEFDGQVGTQEELVELLKRQIKYDNRLTSESIIMVSRAYNIFKEWRLYIVGGEIITASRYRKNFQLSKSADDIPEDMLDFARDRINEYYPHENFAMDIASTHNGEYYVLECGCLNSVGLYHCDINKLFKAIIKWMENK